MPARKYRAKEEKDHPNLFLKENELNIRQTSLLTKIIHKQDDTSPECLVTNNWETR